MSKEPLGQIIKGDSWYVADQIAASQSPEQSKVVANRVKFILKVLCEYRGKAIALLEDQFELKLLDAGCGDGAFLKVVTQLEGFEVYGIDYNPLRIERAKENAPAAIVRQGDLRGLSFQDGFFDVIILSQVLEHILEDTLVLRSLARILKKEGILILGVPNEGCLLARLRNNYLERSISKSTDHVNFYTEGVMRKKIAEAGFSVEKVMREGFFTPHHVIHAWLASRNWGYRFMQFLGKILKSQAAGLYFVCRKMA